MDAMRRWGAHLRSIGWPFFALVALCLGADNLTFAGDPSLPEVSTICGDQALVEKLACRVHREAVWSVASQLSGIAKKHALVSVNQTLPRQGAIEDGIRNATNMLRAAGVDFGDIREQYELQAILSALDVVPTLVSSANYGYLKNSDPKFKPPRNIAEVLERSGGLCGNAVELFEAILTRLGVKTRTVQFWWRGDEDESLNHIASEVFWKGRWRLYDPTYGAYFLQVGNEDAGPLGAQSARSVSFHAVVNPNATTYRNYKLSQVDPFEYLRRSDVDVTIAGKGTIKIHTEADNGTFITKFENVQNYVGDNRQDGSSDGTKFRFPGLTGRFDVKLDIAGAWGCRSSVLFLNDRPIPTVSGVLVVRDVVNPEILEVRGTDDACYVVLNSVRFNPLLGGR